MKPRAELQGDLLGHVGALPDGDLAVLEFVAGRLASGKRTPVRRGFEAEVETGAELAAAAVDNATALVAQLLAAGPDAVASASGITPRRGGR